MSIRFAAPTGRIAARMSRERVRAFLPMAANDDGAVVGQTLMRGALNHFAKHGLHAAQHAREQAIKAGRAGDRQTFEWWLEICRALDRSMARQLDRAKGSSAR
ncbi:MAG: hypothetical protein WBA68_03865 [Alteraurantiacibacter sp.]